MYVSVEVITMVATAAATLVAIVSGFGWMINRMDARFAAVELRFEAQDAKFEARFDRLDRRLDRVECELSEVKVAVGRWEGPKPRLMTIR
ncbi:MULTISPECIES: response regulator [unclassified Microbacterium]|uniref:response regulator n=1 Tax=unclassified Microbacterium TaxID=2609290 RepID=UPI003016D32E